MTRVAVAIFLLCLAAAAEAYVGPGMGLGMVGAALGLLAAIFLALVGMVWYPIKRMIRERREEPAPANGAIDDTSREPPPR